MSFSSLFGWGSPLDSLFSSFSSGISDIFSGIKFLQVFAYVIFILVFALVYYLRGYTLLSTGRKLGISEEFDWMPFVPVAQAAYRQKLLGEPDWKLLFWTDHIFYALSFALLVLFFKLPFSVALLSFALIYLVLGRLATLLIWFVLTVLFLSIPYISAGYSFYAIIVVLYLAGTFGYRFIYTKRLYKLFQINPLFAIHIFVPFGGVIATMFGYLIAFSDNYKAGVKRPQNQSVDYGEVAGSLIGVSGMYIGATIGIPRGEEIVIGRDSAMSHVIVDQNADKISRKHCGIRFDPSDGMYSVTDYSSNGTFKEDGSRLPSNITVTIPRGTVIVLGSRQTSFRLG